MSLVIMNKRKAANTVLIFFCLYLILPLYWLLNMSLRTSQDITTNASWYPSQPTLVNFQEIFSNPVWYQGFASSLSYVLINTCISIVVALPAAYAFSRYRFLGDKHLFFWLLSNRMAPPAVFLLPFFNMYSSIGLFDTPLAVALAHCLFTVPLSVWILEGFMSSIPRQIDELALLDGHSFIHFFTRIFMPLIRAGLGVTVFFCFMFSWVELLLARTLTASAVKPIAVVMTRTVSASGIDWGVLAAAGTMTIIPGLIVVFFVRNYLTRGFAMGRV